MMYITYPILALICFGCLSFGCVIGTAMISMCHVSACERCRKEQKGEV